MVTSVFFDMDGTISDSFEGVSGGILYALEHLNVPAPTREELKSFMGPPLFDEFKRRFCMDDDTAHEAVRLYREYYPRKGIFEQHPNEGAGELLKLLNERGITVCLATSKPQLYSEIILKNFGFEKYFDEIVGATFDGKISAKKDIIALALQKTRTLPENALMVGDRRFDVDGAHACGVRCAGVLCGYGSREELEECGADFIAEKLLDIAKIVTESNQ